MDFWTVAKDSCLSTFSSTIIYGPLDFCSDVGVPVRCIMRFFLLVLLLATLFPGSQQSSEPQAQGDPAELLSDGEDWQRETEEWVRSMVGKQLERALGAGGAWSYSYDDGSCASTCFGQTCEYWGISCKTLETSYGCDCSGCTCENENDNHDYDTPAPTPVSVEAECIDCGRRLTRRKLLFGYLNCC